MNIWGWIISVGLVLGPIIYLILSGICDSISNYAKEVKRKKYYGTKEIINVSTYKSDLTYEDIMDLFLSQIKCYRSYFYLLNYKVYPEPDKQNYAWSVNTNKEIFGWGNVYNVKIHFTNGWACFSTSNKQFSRGEKLSKEYYRYGDSDIDLTLETCRQEAIITWKKHGRKPENNMPFDFYPMSTQRKRTNSTNRTESNKQKEKTAFNNNAPNEILSFYRSLLGLKIQFTQIELKDAYRKAVAKYHPDRYSNTDPRNLENAEMLMKQVNEAYKRLKKSA